MTNRLLKPLQLFASKLSVLSFAVLSVIMLVTISANTQATTDVINNLSAAAGTHSILLKWDDTQEDVVDYLVDYRMSSRVISGSIDPEASSYVVGIGTKFTTELNVFDEILVSGESRLIVDINSDTSLEVNAPFSDNQLDQSVEAIPKWDVYNDGQSTATQAYVEGLTNDVSYDFRIKAKLSQMTTGKKPKNIITEGEVVSATPHSAGFALNEFCTTGLETPDPNLIVVCGSTNQIYIHHSTPNTHVLIEGPETHSEITDNYGGLVIRDIQEHGIYMVYVGDTIGVDPEVDQAYTVEVMASNDHPESSFYQQQELPLDSQGYMWTRDSTLLGYRLYEPAQGCSNLSPCDILVTYSGYGPGLTYTSEWDDNAADYFVPEGYAVFGVNMRGTGCSSGSYDLMEENVYIDGYDIIETLAAQDWVDKVGMVDKSWPGLSQLFVAQTQPPSLEFIVPGAPVVDFYRDVMYPGGTRNNGFGLAWTSQRDAINAYPTTSPQVNQQIQEDAVCLYNQALRGQNISGVNSMNIKPFYDSYWQQRTTDLSKIEVPTMMVVSWQDAYTGSRPADSFKNLTNAPSKKLIVSNGDHDRYYAGDVFNKVIEFVNTYMRGSEAEIANYEAQDTVTVFIEMSNGGASRGSYTMNNLDEALDGERLNFGSDLQAVDSTSAQTNESVFIFDSTFEESYFYSPDGEKVSFVTPTLTEDKLYTGSGSLDLWVSTQITDVELRATITEVRPDGKEMFVQSGWLRGSRRALNSTTSTTRTPQHLFTPESVSYLLPGQPTEMRMYLPPFAHNFREGSRINVTIDAAPGPWALTGDPLWYFDSQPNGIQVSILHSSQNQSSIVLPLITDPITTSALNGLSLPDCSAINAQPCWASTLD